MLNRWPQSPPTRRAQQTGNVARVPYFVMDEVANTGVWILAEPPASECAAQPPFRFKRFDIPASQVAEILITKILLVTPQSNEPNLLAFLLKWPFRPLPLCNS